MKKIGNAVSVCAVITLGLFPPVSLAQTLPGRYTTSWVGNSFMEEKGRQWVPDEVRDMAVDAEGTVFTAGYSESGGSGAAYKNGQFVGRYSGFESGFGDPVKAVAVHGSKVYWGGGNGVTIYPYGGGTAPERSLLKGKMITGLAIAEGNLYVSDFTDNLIRVYDLKTLTQTAQWAMTRPGKIAALQNGRVWIIQYAENSSPDTILTGTKVLSFSSNGKPGAVISDVTNPQALAVNTKNQLLVGGLDPASQVRIYREDGAFVGTFGIKGGIFSGVPGAVAPLKFHWIKGLGVDGAGNIYVGCTYGGTVWGQSVEAYSPSGKKLWQVFGNDYVDCGGIDPAKETEIYDSFHHYHLDYSKAGGREWSFAGYTLNRFKYPNDPRLHGGNGPGFRQSIGLRRIQGKPFLFCTDQAGYSLEIYRFNPAADGEVAIPSVMINGGGQNTIKRDANGDGTFGAGETALGATGYQQYYEVTDDGDILTTGNAAGPSTIITYPLQGIDNAGNPIYRSDDTLTKAASAEFGSLRRIVYDKAKRVIYLGGRAKGSNDEGFDVVARYDNWPDAPKKAWSAVLPYNDADYIPNTNYGGGMPTVLRVKGDYIFVAYGFGYLRVLNRANGKYVGTIKPSMGGFAGGGGQIDGVHAMTVTLRANGEYVLLLEDAGHNHLVMVRWIPNAPSLSTQTAFSSRKGNAK